MSAPAVYRNARYERQLVRLAQALAELTDALANLGALVRIQGDAIAGLARAANPDTHIPALPEVKGRAFGMGR